MPRKASTTTKPTANVRSLKAVPNGVKGPMTFTAIPIKREDMPKPSRRGGRASNVPAIEAFLTTVSEPGVTYEMGSSDEDGAHPVNRVAQVKKIAGEKFKVETAPIESGKRYRIFVTLAS
jgi:hypothetical protein